jgi:septum formation protein
MTGVVMINMKTNKKIKRHAQTMVRFDEMTEEEIATYVDSGEPFDKAGGYGIQGLAGKFIKEIAGCYYNVVGFPLNLCKNMLDEIIK